MDRPPHLDIDLNEAPSPPPCDTPPARVPSPPRELSPPVYAPPPPPPQPQLQPQLPPLLPLAAPNQQLRLHQESLDVVLRVHRPPELRNTPFGTIANMPAGMLPALGALPLLPPPAPHPGEAGWGNPPLPCSSCGRQEVLGSTLVCDACDRGFHPTCVRVWPPLPPPPPPPGPPGTRRPRAAANEDWICPECEMRGARSSRWKLGPVPLDINAAPPEDPVAVTPNDIGRRNITDGPQLPEFTNLPHFEGIHLRNTALYDGMQFMPAFDLAHCVGMRRNFTSMDRDLNADGNVPQRSIHLRRKRDLPQTSTLPKVVENHEFGGAGTSMDPSFFTKPMEQNPSESSLKPPKFLVENSNNHPHNRTVVLPVQYRDFFITSLGEIDNRISYHNSYQIWPIGFTSYWHDRVTGSLFECEVCDGGNFGPLFKMRRLPCSAFQLPDASTIVCPNVVRKADTIETKEGSGLIEDADKDTDDNISMLLDFSETNQDILSCLSNDMGGKESLGSSNAKTSNMTVPGVQSDSGSFSWAPTNESNMYDKIGDFTYEGTSPSSVWRMIFCATMEACEKMYKEHGHLVLFCTHSSEKPSFDYGSGSKQTDGPCNLLARFCSSNGPRIPRFIDKENDVESACALLKEWLFQDRIGFDLEFVQEIVESLPKSRACSNYQFLRNRNGIKSPVTISSGTLLAVNKNNPSNGHGMSHGRHGSVVSGPQDHPQPSSFIIRELPPGNPISRKLPPELAGDVFQILEFLGRFAEIIGLKELPSMEQVEDELIDPWPSCANQKDIQHYMDCTPPMNSPANVSTSYSNGESGTTTNEEMASVFIPVETSSTWEAAQDKLAAETLGRCSGVVLPEIHLALLKVLFTEVVSRAAIFVDPRIDLKESKSKRGRKRDTDNLTRELKIDMLTANELTWPELARRYILAVSSMSGCMDLSDISSREGVKLFRCLQGDGGVLCGALPGVVGMEKDASLLAEAETLICNSSVSEGNKVFMMDHKDTDVVDSPEEPASDSTLPDWVKSLEPVRKLPTNVGTRIRKCVYEALEKKPPEWARKVLEHSISKEVYKGNASGPTKKAVLSVLAEACRREVPQNPEKPKKERNIISISEAILKKCRIAMRRAISSDESKQFANLLGTTLTNSNENEDDGILGFPGMVSRPLDFRTIDIRLAMGAYHGSWEAFLDDVQEVINNLQTAYGDRPEALAMVVALSRSFESLYKAEVQDLIHKFDKYLSIENGNSEIHQELQDALTTSNNKLPKAPWEDGVCKVCGIDKDDESVLLCDICDSEYHTYCLNPPLARIPLGNWYCPSCLTGKQSSNLELNTHVLMQEQKKSEEAHVFLEKLNNLAMSMDEKEYWELGVHERIYLLKFLCDELLNTALIREHIDQCSDRLNDLQQKLRHMNYELKESKYRVEIRTYATQSRWMKNDHASNGSGFVENQQCAMPTVSEHLEEADVGVNLNNPAEGAPAGQLTMGKPCGTDNNIPSKSVTEKQQSETVTVTDRIDGASICEGSENCKSVGSNIGEAHFVTNTPNGEFPDENARTSSHDNLEASATKLVEHDADDNETNSLMDRISQLQDSISTAESQLSMASLRRECLGRDSVGRLYWISGRPGKRPRLVADGSMLIPKDKDIRMVTSYPQSTFDSRGYNSAQIFIYESDEEIKSLVDWLRDNDPREEDLKDSILHWQKSLYQQASFPGNDLPVSRFSKREPLDLPNTKAFTILEQKYGLQLDQDTSELFKKRGRKTKSGSEERIYRCDCLEPIWPSRHHCLTCHETYLTSTEYEGHNGGKCKSANESPNGSKENEEPKLMGAKSDIKGTDPADHNCSAEPSNSGKLESCPYEFEEICRKFITNDSNKETVKEIGLLGSNGFPSFVPSPAFFLDRPALLNENKRKDDMPNDWTSSLEECQAMSAKRSVQEGSQGGQDCPGTAGDDQMPKSKKPAKDSTSSKEASSTNKPTRLLAVNGGLVPESSLMPVIGRNFHILKQLKINLLDVEAALPEEALRASKSQQIRIRSWRAFVKDAESISYVVLATNFLQSMIKAEFLKKDWWYWSSFTAAIKTTTMSSLALRIYTLDDCIMYTKDPAPNPEPADNAKSGNKGKRKKDTDS